MEFELVLNLSDGVCSDLLVIDSPDSGNTIYGMLLLNVSACLYVPMSRGESRIVVYLYMYHLVGEVVLHMKESTGDASEI